MSVPTRPIRVVAVLLLVLGTLGAAPLARALPEDAGAPAGQQRDERGDIVISKNAEFDRDHGVRRGAGTARDPYVISGWALQNLVIRNTNRHVVIENTEVRGQMVLDWIGRVRVRRNTVRDLRVNQNVERSGPMTDGVISNNRFDVVGQLRHWDGVFEDNVIGSEKALVRQPDFRAVNFDGFNGARFRNNTIYGYVDVKLHGHHHSSRYGSHSHDHYGDGSADMIHDHHGNKIRHDDRYHQVWITGNKIFSEYAWALRYYDRNHTGDDRTAASETNKLLNCPHVHHTKVHISGNKLEGGALMIDVFNAGDDNHWSTKRGLVEIRNNYVKLTRDSRQLLDGRYGIVVQEATDVDVKIDRNVIDGPNLVGDEMDILKLENKLNVGAGILLNQIDMARLWVTNNQVAYRQFGVQAGQFTETVKWWVRGLRTIQVDEKIHRDGSVQQPRR